MEFVDKYLMPHKGKIVLLILSEIILTLITPANFTAEKFNFVLPVFVLTVFYLALFAWIGWEGRQKLHYRWQDSAIAGMSIELLVTIVWMIFSSVLTWLKIGFAYGVKFGLIDGIQNLAFCTLVAVGGHAAAKYLGGKQAVKAKKRTKD